MRPGAGGVQAGCGGPAGGVAVSAAGETGPDGSAAVHGGVHHTRLLSRYMSTFDRRNDMVTIHAISGRTLALGREGENLARQVVFDIRDLESLYGTGDVEVIYQRPCDAQPYPLTVQREGTLVTWDVTSTDTEMSGNSGKCELRYYVGETLAKSKTWRTWVEPAMDTPSETTPPEPEKGWVDQVLDAKQTAEKAAVDAKADADRTAVLAAEVAQNASQVAQNVSYTNEAKEAAVLSASEAAQSAQEAAGSASVASTSETNAKSSEESAKAAQSAAQQSATSAAESAAVYDTVVADVNNLKQDLGDLQTKELCTPENIFNSENARFGYMTLSGNISTSSSLRYTEKINVSEGDVIRVYRNESSGLSVYAARFITAFNGNTAVASKGAENNEQYTVPSGITSVVLTISVSYTFEITKNSIPTEYTEYFTPYTVTTVKQNVLPKASETDFGVAKMWVTIDADGNKVLNISTGDKK